MDTLEYRELWHDHNRSWFESKTKSYDKLNDDVVVTAIYSMISLGTESLIVKGGVAPESAKEMSVPGMQGDFQSQFTYGYSLVGEVINGPDRLKNRKVHLMHPHQEYVFVKEQEIFCVPEGVALKNATLASNMETAVNALWDSKICIGEKVLIVGYGLIGALVATLIKRYPGIDLTILEKNPSRFNKASRDGFRVLSESSQLATDHDLAFNTSADEKGLQTAIDSTAFEGRIVELSWYGSGNVNLSLGNSFHYHRKKIISSQVSHIPAHMQYGWDYVRRKQLVFKLLEELNPSYLIDKEISYTDTPDYFQKLRENAVNDFSTIISY